MLIKCHLKTMLTWFPSRQTAGTFPLFQCFAARRWWRWCIGTVSRRGDPLSELTHAGHPSDLLFPWKPLPSLWKGDGHTVSPSLINIWTTRESVVVEDKPRNGKQINHALLRAIWYVRFIFTATRWRQETDISTYPQSPKQTRSSGKDGLIWARAGGTSPGRAPDLLHRITRLSGFPSEERESKDFSKSSHMSDLRHLNFPKSSTAENICLPF